MAKFWFTVTELEKLLFIFLDSLHDLKFDFFIRCFEKMFPWLAALNHIHYLKWRTVFLNDIKDLPHSIKEAFDQGNFTVKKTSRVFSAMEIGQAHEQNNRAVKVDGGTIDIIGNEMALKSKFFDLPEVLINIV